MILLNIIPMTTAMHRVAQKPISLFVWLDVFDEVEIAKLVQIWTLLLDLTPIEKPAIDI